MSEESLNSRIQSYKKVYESGEFQATHQKLVGVVQNLRTDFLKRYRNEMSVASVMHGYVDFTYFYVQTDFLKNRKLKLAIVLNHREVQFELWLLGQTKVVQKEYWEKFQNTKWVTQNEMPVWSIFEVTLNSSPDFDNSTNLLQCIHKEFVLTVSEINNSLEILD